MGGWPVVHSFEAPHETIGIGLVDLSHRPKAIVKGQAVGRLAALKPGQALFTGHALVGCLKPDEAIVFDLTGPIEPQWPDLSYTDVTDGWILLGLWGPKSIEVIQRLVAVDVEPPDTKGPLHFATGSHGIHVRLINLRGRSPGFLIACYRSYGQNIFDACIREGRQFDLKVVGQKAFYEWFETQVR
jgi:glycine cleavage system aminomethyltransferase T